MEDLCQYSYDVCRQSIALDNIGSWLEFIDTLPSAPSSPTGTGTSSPLPQTITVFGSYAQRLRDDVFHFLVVTLPEVLDVQESSLHPQESSAKSGRDVLLQIFSMVPFEMFKAAVESPTFQIGGLFPQDRPCLSSDFSKDLTSHVSSLRKMPLQCVSEVLLAVPEPKRLWYWPLGQPTLVGAQFMSLEKCASDHFGRSTLDVPVIVYRPCLRPDLISICS